MTEIKSHLTPKEWMSFYDELFREREPVIHPPRSGEGDVPDVCPLPLPRDLGAAAGKAEKAKG